MSFNVALSGLRAANQDLAVTGNNIANASTVGFKRSRAEFADVYAGSVLGTGTRTPGSGVLVSSIAQQFGQGNISITNNSLDLAISGEGFFVLEDRGSPVYTRAGVFGLDKNGYIVGNNNARLQGFPAANNEILSGAPQDLYIETADIPPSATTSVSLGFNLDSRSGIAELPAGRAASLESAIATPAGFDFTASPSSFQIVLPALNGAPGTVSDTITLNGNYGDQTTFLAAVEGQLNNVDGRVSFSVNGDGELVVTQNPSQSEEMTVTATSGTLFAGSTSATGTALDPTSPNSYNWSTAATIYDSLGNDHILTTYYRKVDATSNEWEVFSQIGDGEPERLGSAQFDDNGRLIATRDVNGTDRAGLGFVVTEDIGGGADELVFALNFSSSTQHGSTSGVNSLNQDGYAPGRLAGLTINDGGVISARYTNGQQMVLGQVALANFSNPQGLTPIGNSAWAASFDSGQAVVGEPQTASLGAIQSGALEDSNVDLSDQLVNLIIAQRNYQANAKTIETSNAVTQSIINLR